MFIKTIIKLNALMIFTLVLLAPVINNNFKKNTLETKKEKIVFKEPLSIEIKKKKDFKTVPLQKISELQVLKKKR